MDSEMEDSYYTDYDDENDMNVEEDNEYDSTCDSHLKEKYVVLREDEICKQQEEAIEDVTSVLFISSEEARILLRHFKWSVSVANEEWFANEEEVRKASGLPSVSKALKLPRRVQCMICYDRYGSDSMRAALCREHFYCTTCWAAYVHTAVADGPGCLNLRCPDPSCRAAVGERLVESVSSKKDFARYSKYLLRSFVEENKDLKWCPAPGCELAVKKLQSESSSCAVECLCSHDFCWNCLEQHHWPLECDIVREWMVRNNSESETWDWILANSKACPKCRRAIEKNQGCMHMTCSDPCRYEFCWLCMGPWKGHGGFYSCNRYEGNYTQLESKRNNANHFLDRYVHYYERWTENESSRKMAISSLQNTREKDIAYLCNTQKTSEKQLEFILDAWRQIIECRRVLKWTYAYGYYIPEKERTKKNYFEYLQGQAEKALERLHDCAEKEIQGFLQDTDETPNVSFVEFCSRLTDLTSVTKTFFQHIGSAVEKGLMEVQ